MVKKPYNNGTWTKARYMQQIRSFMRNAFRYWKPIQQCRLDARQRNDIGLTTEKGNHTKWKFQCSHCNGWFIDKHVQVDHKIPCGSIKELYDVPLFIERLSAEEGYELLCKECHKKVTAIERTAPVTELYWQERINYYMVVIKTCEREIREIKNKETK